MRKVSLVIITLIYVVMSSGITLSYHYCMSHLTDVKVMALADNCTSCKKNNYSSYRNEKQTSSCCSDKTQFIKITQDQNISYFVADLSPATIELLSLLFNDSDFLQQQNLLADYHVFDDPPESTDTPLFIHHCTFLI